MEDEELGALSSVVDAESAAIPGLTGNPQALAVLNSIRAEQKKRYDEYAASIRAARNAQLQQMQAAVPSKMERLADALIAAGRPNQGRSNWESLRQGVESWDRSGEAARQLTAKQQQLAAADEAELAKTAFEQGSSLENLAAKYALAPQKTRRTGFNPVTGELVYLDTGDLVNPNAKPAPAGPPQAPPTVEVPVGDGKTVTMIVTRGPQGRVEYTPVKKPEPTLDELVTRTEQVTEAKKTGENRAEAKRLLPGALNQASAALTGIDELLKHPGMSAVIGMPDPFKGGLGVTEFPGSPAAGFETRRKQLAGGAFLTAFNTLRGGGAITEAEGQKGTDAIARMSKAQSEEEFVAAMEDFRRVILSGVAALKAQAAGSAVPLPLSNTPVQGSVTPSAAPARGGAKPLPANLLEQYRRVPAANRVTAKERLRAAGYDISGLN